MHHFSSRLLLTGALLAGAASQSGLLAQTIYNSGSAITLLGGATVYAGGNLTNTGGGTIAGGGGTVRVDGNFANTGTGSSIALGTAGTLEVRGNLSSAAAATFSGGTGTVTLAGTTGAQTLDVNAATLPNLTVNNTAATAAARLVNLASNASVSGTLLLTSGSVNTQPATTLNTLALLNGAAVSGEATGRYVVGRLSETKNAVAGSSPVVYSSGVSVTPNATLGALTITRTAGLKTAQVSYGTNAAGTTKGIDRIWQFSTAPGAAASLTFSWLADDDNGNASFAQAQAWGRTAAPVAGSPWAVASATQSATTRTLTTPGGTFTYWTVSTSANPLPVRPALAADLALLAYPNPAGADGTTVEVEARVAGLAQVQLYDALGRQLATTTATLAVGRNSLPLAQAGQLAAGTYLLRVQQGQQAAQLRLTRE